MKMKTKPVDFTEEENEILYKIVKEHHENAPKTEEEYYDHHDDFEEPIDKNILSSLLKKISKNLSPEGKEAINKDFLRKKYHPFNNELNEKAYSVVEKAFSRLKTIEMSYFNMGDAEFTKRRLDIYYKSRKYIIGYCHLRKGIRKFRASRIASAKITPEAYTIPRNFDKNKY